MKDIYKMSKVELILYSKSLQTENERLQAELDSLSDCYFEMENQCANVINAYNATDMIKNVAYFKLRLQIDHLLTPQLENFIDFYLKYYNEKE